LLDLQVRGEQVKLLAEITLTLVLFADASRISLRALRHESAVPLRLLGIGLPLTILAGALIGAAVIRGISLAEALVLAIVLACTDAALGQAVVSDERVPSRIRQGLNVESGLNDGLCVPLFSSRSRSPRPMRTRRLRSLRCSSCSSRSATALSAASPPERSAASRCSSPRAAG
jgi:NhaP-type Na+/H+ or K+/H+ antiporter